MARQQLPPQIKKINLIDRKTGRSVPRYELRCGSGTHPVTGGRIQVRRRFTTEREARQALSEISDQAEKGTFVPKSALTVEQVCANYVVGAHNLRPSSKAKLEYDLAPLRQRHGELPVQRLTKADIDSLVADLREGGTKTGKERTRKPWSPSAVNKTISSIDQVLADAHRQGLVARNVASLVSRVAAQHVEVDTYSEDEVQRLLASISADRIAHAWELAMSGLRRGEIAGLRWSDVDLEAGTLSVTNNRVHAGDAVVENGPKSRASQRTLPLPERFVKVLRAAKKRQTMERLRVGGGEWSYVVCNEGGEPYHPQVLSRLWARAVKAAGLRHIKLHAARHTCATIMHLQGVPVAVIAAWIGHKDATLTMKVYAHSQLDALKAAGATLDRPNIGSC